mmetsp:Transcript_274/g.1046  ORF Transcript_274/g.1046 Transcript_274/m.1046 type:complete len:312 (-) Transcript_274:18-953(-)
MCSFASCKAPSHVRSIAATSSAPSCQEITATKIFGFSLVFVGFDADGAEEVADDGTSFATLTARSSETTSPRRSEVWAFFSEDDETSDDEGAFFVDVFEESASAAFSVFAFFVSDASSSTKSCFSGFFAASTSFSGASIRAFVSSASAFFDRPAAFFPEPSSSAFSRISSAPRRCVLSPRPADASEEKASAFSPRNCVWKKSSASVPSRARTETASPPRPDVTESAQMSTKSAAAQGKSAPAAVTCHRHLGFFSSAEPSAVTPTSLARGSGAHAPPALGNSARVSPFDIAAAAVTSREVEDEGALTRRGKV